MKKLMVVMAIMAMAAAGCSSKFLGADQDITMYAANIKVKAQQGQPLTVNVGVPIGGIATGTVEAGVVTTFTNVDEFESRGTGYRIVTRGEAHNIILQGFGDYTVAAAQGDTPAGSEQDGAHQVLFNLMTQETNLLSDTVKFRKGFTVPPWEVYKPAVKAVPVEDEAINAETSMKVLGQ